MDKYLADVQYFGENCIGKQGYYDVLGNKGIKNDGQPAVEGAAFMLRVLSDNNLADIVDKFETTYNTANDKVVDIVHVSGKLIECKSWAIGSGAFQFFKTGRTANGGSFAQFTSYLRNGISTMNDLEYWFDAKKESSETNLKIEFKNMMYNGTALTAQGNDVFDAIWGNATLRGNLFSRANYPNMNDTQYKDAAKEDFATFISYSSNSFYDFIKVK